MFLESTEKFLNNRELTYYLCIGILTEEEILERVRELSTRED